MNRIAKTGIIGTCLGLFALGGVGAYNIVSGLTGSGHAAGPASTGKSSAAPDNAASVKLANTFLANWEAGPDHYAAAASDTNAPTAVQQDLADYQSQLGLTSISFSDVAPTGPSTSDPGATGVGFIITARVSGGTWSYPSSLNVIQNNSGVTSVDWSPTILYSKLTAGQKLMVGTVDAPSTGATVVDDKGVALTATQFPSLTDILSQLKTNYGAKASGQSGTGVVVINPDGSTSATVKVFTAPRGGTIKTTLDGAIQAAAEKAVNDPQLQGKPAGVVAIDHRTGDIRAIAFSGNEGDFAINGFTPPGSTMKIISSAALIDEGGLSPQSRVACPPSITVDGQVFGNVDSEQNVSSSADMSSAFQMSCNTAYIDMMDNAWQGNDSVGFAAQSKEAHNVFGIGSWNIGVSTTDPQVNPATSRNGRAGDVIGQGDIAMSPLVMASIGATVAQGQFLQPILIPGMQQTPATTPLAPSTDYDIQQMMLATAQSGTAAPRTGGMSGVGAKTGTAEVGPNGATTTNGWFVAYDSDLSICAEVIGGHQGVDSAGYVVADILTADGHATQ